MKENAQNAEAVRNWSMITSYPSRRAEAVLLGISKCCVSHVTERRGRTYRKYPPLLRLNGLIKCQEDFLVSNH